MGARSGGGASGGMGRGSAGGSVESRVQAAIKKAGWSDEGFGTWQLDTGDNGIGGGMILEDSSPTNKYQYGQKTVYEVQNVWDKNYNIKVNKQTGFSSLASAKKFVQDTLVKLNT